MASITQPFAEPSRAEILQRLAATQRAQAATMEALAAALEALAEEPEPAPIDEDPMLTVSEAARELRCSPSHLRTACRRGALKAMRAGRAYRVRRSALHAYERRRTGA